MKKLNYSVQRRSPWRPKADRFNASGQVLVIVIILILIFGGGLWYLVSHKQEMDKEARAFGHEAIQRIVINRDAAFLANALSPQGKLDTPPSDQQMLMTQLQQLGPPAQPFQIEENITWEKNFFEPHGFFTAHLSFPAGPATLQIAIDHPVARWELMNVTFTPPSQAR